MNCSFTLEYKSGDKTELLTEKRLSGGCALLNVCDDGQRRTVKIKALKPIKELTYVESSHSFIEKTSADPSGDLYFMNGYQSWTDSREFYLSERERDVTRLPKGLVKRFALDRYGDPLFHRYDRRELHGYDYFYSKGSVNAFAASLNGDNAYLIFTVNRESGALSMTSDLRSLTLEPGQEYTLCDYIYARNPEDGFALLEKYAPEKEIKKIFGYTSWYNYYQDINSEVMLRDLDALDRRFNLFQIDDGYETFVGDWLDVDPVKFPAGLSPLVEKIHRKGYMAGIWLAPFVAEEKSRLFRENPDFFKKGEDGLPVKCGANWSGFYALDLDNPRARDYISSCLSHYAKAGFDFFKLDFLYAANLPLYEGRTRARAASEAYSFLREVLADKLILGCGATLSNAAGRFDYLRIGPDVSLKFDDVWFMRFMHRERISTKVTLQNTIYRSFMDRRFFGNDPDVFLLRDSNISLSPGQRSALITINALFGSVMMTSDNVAEYDGDKKSQLSAALDLFECGRVVGFERRGNRISVRYEAHGGEAEFVYDTEKGLMI